MKNCLVISIFIFSLLCTNFVGSYVSAGDEAKKHSSYDTIKIEGVLVEAKDKNGEKTISIYTLKCEKNVNFFLGWSGDPDVEKVKLKDYVGKTILVTANGSLKSGKFIDSRGVESEIIPTITKLIKIEIVEKNN